MRILSSLFLVVLLASFPRPMPVLAAACDPATESESRLGVVEEAYNILRVLYVDRLPADELLNPASQALRVEVGEEGEQSSIGSVATFPQTDLSDWPVFADEFCATWKATHSDPASSKMAYAAISAMTRSVHEGHTRFMTPSMYADHQAWAAGDARYEGIGLRLKSNPLGVQYVFPGGPADSAGLAVGDNVLAIDGEPATDFTASQAVAVVRGESGTAVRLTIERPSAGKTWDVEIVRASIKVPVLETRMIGDIAYMHLQGFPNTDLPSEVAAELRSFQKDGAKALVLDLRGNSGGRLDVGKEVASYFLPPNTPVYQQTTRRGQTTTATSLNDRLWTRPVEVLVDDGTASMGEILAAALQEQKTATVIGIPTAGSVAGSIVVPLSDGSAIQVTTLRIDSGLGKILNNIGVQPDIDVPTDAEAARVGRDDALDVAVLRLRGQLGPSASDSSSASVTPGPAATMQATGGPAPTN